MQLATPGGITLSAMHEHESLACAHVESKHPSPHAARITYRRSIGMTAVAKSASWPPKKTRGGVEDVEDYDVLAYSS